MKNLKIGGVTVSGWAALAPMSGVADRSMRVLCMEKGAAFCVGELTSAKALVLHDGKTEKFCSSAERERPFAAQLFGCDPDIMAEAARIAAGYNPCWIDINMGCPAPKITAGGAGSALMKNPELAGKIVRAAAGAVSLPVTVKIRAGWDDGSVNAVDVAKAAEQNGAAAITVHGRTRQQMYAPPCNLAVISAVKKAVSVPVIANGDIVTPNDAERMYRETGCDFIMIGRAAAGNPFVFERVNAFLETGIVPPDPPLRERLALMKRQITLMRADKGDAVAFKEARKQTAFYMRGLNGAAELRRRCSAIRGMNDVDELCGLALKFNAG